MCVAKSDGNEVFISMQPNTLENFIPVHPNEFQAAIEHSDFINVQAWEKVRELKGSLSEILHRRARRDYGPLFEAYVPFDPDRDGLVSKFVATRTTAEVFEQAELLLEHANYRRLRPSEIYEAVRTTSAWGGKLRIRMSDYKRLRVYARGDTQTQRTKRLWYRWFRKCEISVPIYKQLVVLFERRSPTKPTAQSKGKAAKRDNGQEGVPTELVHCRMFKNIPHSDVDMLLPGSIRISWLDQGKIGIPTLWGFSVMVTRLVRNVWLVAILTALKIFSAAWIYIAVLVAAVIYGVKFFFSYRHARNRHLLQVTQSLYGQTLANNKGVLLRLRDEAEQQDLTEAMVVLYVLFDRASQGKTLYEIDQLDFLDRDCELLLDRLGLGKIDFDIHSTARFLCDEKFLNPGNGTWDLSPSKVVP